MGDEEKKKEREGQGGVRARRWPQPRAGGRIKLEDGPSKAHVGRATHHGAATVDGRVAAGAHAKRVVHIVVDFDGVGRVFVARLQNLLGLGKGRKETKR